MFSAFNIDPCLTDTRRTPEHSMPELTVRSELPCDMAHLLAGGVSLKKEEDLLDKWKGDSCMSGNEMKVMLLVLMLMLMMVCDGDNDDE